MFADNFVDAKEKLTIAWDASEVNGKAERR